MATKADPILDKILGMSLKEVKNELRQSGIDPDELVEQIMEKLRPIIERRCEAGRQRGK